MKIQIFNKTGMKRIPLSSNDATYNLLKSGQIITDISISQNHILLKAPYCTFKVMYIDKSKKCKYRDISIHLY